MQDKKPQINKNLLTVDQQYQLESYHAAQKQLQTLGDIADIVHEITNQLDDKTTDNKVGALLVDIRESLASLNSKEAPETPDFAKPVVDAVSKLEKALNASIKAIDVKPSIKVDAPTVTTPPIDTSRIESAVKEIPKAFEKAVKLINIPETPKTDFQPLLDAWEGISEQLVSIENATRMKPVPGSMAITGTVTTTGLTDTELRASPIEVNAGNKDIFGYQVFVQPYNQIELRADDSDWADFVTETNLNGGNTAQSGGLLNITTSTATNGSAILNSIDAVKYRPGVGVFGGGTMIFTAGVTGSNQYFGLSSDTAFADGLAFGYKGTSFGIRYTSGGAEISFTPQASWDDPCLGAATSNFTRAGAAEALDATRNNLYRFEAGLFGFAGWRAQVWSPDNGWITVLTHKHINTGTTPVFTSNTFYIVASNIKTSGATNISMTTQCWAGGSGTPLMRIGSTTLSDRTLAQTTRSVIAGRSTAGGTSYVNVKVSPSGAVQVGGTLDTITSLPLPSGAATSAKQDTAQTSLNTLVTDIDYRYSGGKTAYSTTIAASGNTDLIVPTSGHHLEIYWVSFVPNSDNSAANLVKLGFGTSGGAISTELYRSYAMAHWEYFVGATNQAFIINTGTAEPVAVTVHYKEI